MSKGRGFQKYKLYLLNILKPKNIQYLKCKDSSLGRLNCKWTKQKIKGVKLEIDEYKLSKLKHRVEKRNGKEGKRKQNKLKDIPGTVKGYTLHDSTRNRSKSGTKEIKR